MPSLFTCLWLLTVPLCAVSTCVTAYLVYIHHKYSHIPGPKRASFFYGNNPQFTEAARQGKTSCVVLLEWARTYGRTFVVWNYHEPLVVTVEPDTVKDLLLNGKHPKSHRKYSAFGYVFGARLMGVAFIIECNDALWRPRRIAYNTYLSQIACKGMVDSMNSIMDDMVEYLVPMADGKTPVQLGLLFNRVALDIVTKCVFRKERAKLCEEKCEITLSLYDALQGIDLGMKDSVFGHQRVKFWSNRNVKESARSASKRIRSITRKWLEDRIKVLQSDQYVPNDMLTAMAKIAMTQGYGTELAIDDMLAIYIGGQETTANSIGLAIMELDKFPHIVNKIRIEIEEILGAKNYIDSDDLESLTMIRQTFKEVQRLYPAFPFHFRDIVTDDYKIDGYHVP